MRALFVSAVVFVLCSACERRSSDVQVPIAPEGAELPDQKGTGEPGPMVFVTIDRSGKKNIDEQAFDSTEAIRERFAKALAANPEIGIAIRADARAPYEAVAGIILQAKAAGVSRILLIAGSG